MTTPDASIASDAAIAAEPPALPPPFRAFTQPPPILLAPPAKPTLACQQGPEPGENARLIAALDAELRNAGGWVLPLTMFGEDERLDGRNHPFPPGTIIRGGAGERFMVVGAAYCGEPMPTFVIDGSGEVFEPELVVKAKQTRTQASCQRECFGCGANMPPARLVAEVPDGAHLGALRQVKVPIGVHLVFSYPKTARCIPKP